MDLFRQGMKGPTRPAPAVPGIGVNRYSPVTNWNDDPFSADLFEPTPQYNQKKKPPPRPPPPKLNTKYPDIPTKPSHFIRRPTVLSSLLSRKNKSACSQTALNQHSNIVDFSSELENNKIFPRCEPKNVQTGALIDLSSPPSSPTFTTRSSSDGLSVDSFGSDATTSTNHHNPLSGGNTSQAESGFEDDFDLFLSSRKTLNKEDTLEDLAEIDPFSPQPVSNKPPLMRKPVMNKHLYDLPSSASNQQLQLKGPTIIRAKPARPKPPDNMAILRSTFASNVPMISMNVNTTTPIQKLNNGFADMFDSKPINWESDDSPDRESRESSPPMPSIPPPPPPEVTDDNLPVVWPEDEATDIVEDSNLVDDDTEPYAVALFDYFTDHPDDLCFSANSKVKLIRRVDDEWLYGSLRNGMQGVFPANYVEVKVPLPNESVPTAPRLGSAIALYDFEPVQPGDLRFHTGDSISVMYKLNDEWYFGECNGLKGQFPANYVQMKFN